MSSLASHPKGPAKGPQGSYNENRVLENFRTETNLERRRSITRTGGGERTSMGARPYPTPQLSLADGYGDARHQDEECQDLELGHVYFPLFSPDVPCEATLRRLDSTASLTGVAGEAET